MPKILISDYDNTFYTNEQDVLKNVHSIKKFRQVGNLFVICTARAPESIEEKMKKYQIECDYVISYLGAVIKQNNKRIYINYMDDEVIDFIEENLKKFEGIVIKKKRIDENALKNEIIGYSINTNNNRETVSNLIQFFNGKKNIFSRTFDNDNVYINNSLNTKLKAIDYLVNFLNISKDDVYTIGDYDDDLEMIQNFNGYRMKESSDLLVKNVNQYVSSVRDLVEIILNKK